MENTSSNALYDLLVTQDLDPKIFDSSGPVEDPNKAELYSFDWVGPTGKNYGTVVILLNSESGLEVYSGDNIGKTMEPEDKRAWYGTSENNPGFLGQLKSFAITSNLGGGFGVNNINRLKHTMKGIAAIKEGLFEGYYGKKNISYSDQPKQVRLMIKHNRNILEGEPRHRAIESLYVETADGERFRVPSRSLAHGRMIARHVAEGGNPYDAFGNHINEIVTEIATLARFIRAAKHKPFTGEAATMVEAAVRHYSDLKAKAKQMISQRGYHEARESYDPAEINNSSEMAESIRNMFIEQTLDSRIEEALPILAKLKETPMREADEFESWTNRVMEGTWALPDDPETERQLKDLMSKPLIVGADATNATEQLYDLVGDDILFDRLGDLADRDPNANCWEDPGVINRLGELGIDINPTTGPESGEQDMTEMDEAVIPDPKYDHEPPAQESDPIPDDPDMDPMPDDDVAEGEDRVDTLVTTGLPMMRNATWLDAVAAIKYQVGQRDYRERKQFYDIFVQQLVDRKNAELAAKKESVAEASLENKYSNLSNRGVNRGIRRAGDDFNRLLDLDQAQSPHYKTQHQQATKQRLKTKPMAGPKGQLPEQGMAEGYDSVESDYQQWEDILVKDGYRMADPSGAYALELVVGNQLMSDPAEVASTIRNILAYVKQNRQVLGKAVADRTTVKDAIIDIKNKYPRQYQAAQQPQGVAEGHEDSSVASALTRRIMTQRLDLLKKYGPVKVTQAIDDAAEFFGDVEEIGSSDMHAYMQYVEKALGGMNEQELAEGHGSYYALQLAEKVFAEMSNLQNEDDIIKAGYDMAKQEPNLGTSVNGIFRDRDFVSDFVTNYVYLQKQGMAEDLDTDGVMMTKPSNMSSESVDPVLRLKQMLKY